MDKTSIVIARLVGGVSLAFGITSGILGIWAIDRQFAIGRVVWVSAAVVVAIFLTIAVFCCLVGYRLLFNRSNRYGMLLSRTSWKFISLFFWVIALTVAAILLGRGSPGAWLVVVGLGLLAFGSSVAAGIVHRKAAFSPLIPAGTSLLQLQKFVPRGFSSGIEIMNDNATPMIFVVSVLQGSMGLSEKDAVRKMLEIHRQGGALLPTASFDEATRIAKEITEKAKASNHPLVCRAVRVE